MEREMRNLMESWLLLIVFPIKCNYTFLTSNKRRRLSRLTAVAAAVPVVAAAAAVAVAAAAAAVAAAAIEFCTFHSNSLIFAKKYMQVGPPNCLSVCL